jgi:hypothetical protein
MKPIPASARQRSTTSGPTITFSPSSVSASAAPDLDDRLRLPCLATTTPAPATTKAVAVEMFSVPLPSPPVPTISIAPAGAFTGWHLARITLAAAAYSSTVSPRVRSAIRKPPICAGVPWPSKRASKAETASSRVRGRDAAMPIRGFRTSLMRGPWPWPRQGSSATAGGRVPRRCFRGGTARPRSDGCGGAGP